jgi:tetratricopeptide (TPR) repeat protein
MIKQLLARYFVSLAKGYAQSCIFDPALSASSRALALDQTCAEALMLRGWLRATHLKQPEGMHELTQAVNLKPDSIEAHRYRGDAYCSLGFYEQAIADANYILSTKPDNPEALIIRGTAYRRMKQYDQALGDIAQALIARPRDAGIVQTQAFIYEALGDYNSALIHYDIAINLNSRHAYLFFYRARLHKQLGNEVKAQADYERALKLNPAVLLELFDGAVARREQDRENAITTMNDLLAFCEDPILEAKINEQLQLLAQSV